VEQKWLPNLIQPVTILLLAQQPKSSNGGSATQDEQVKTEYKEGLESAISGTARQEDTVMVFEEGAPLAVPAVMAVVHSDGFAFKVSVIGKAHAHAVEVARLAHGLNRLFNLSFFVYPNFLVFWQEPRI